MKGGEIRRQQFRTPEGEFVIFDGMSLDESLWQYVICTPDPEEERKAQIELRKSLGLEKQ